MTTTKVDAIAYVEWGGAYDTRELELIEYPAGRWFYEDLTGGCAVSLTQETAYESPREAKRMLLSVVFALGEPDSFIDFGDAGIIRKCDPQAWVPIMGEFGFIAL